MENDSTSIEISPGTRALFKALRDNDKRGALFNNYTLFYCLEVLTNLYEISGVVNKIEAQKQLLNWLSQEVDLPKNFLFLCARVLKKVNEDVIKRDIMERRNINEASDINFSSDYDVFLLQAFAETLSDTMWFNKKTDDISGPSINECLDNFAAQELKSLWIIFLTNYIGNLLQYMFEVLKIRMTNPDLPVSLEQDLKQREALEVLFFLFEEITITGEFVNDARKVLKRFGAIYNLLMPLP